MGRKEALGEPRAPRAPGTLPDSEWLKTALFLGMFPDSCVITKVLEDETIPAVHSAK